MTGRRRLRPPESPPTRRGWVLTAMLAVLFLAVGAAATLAITGSQQRLDATVDQAVAAADPVLDLCGDPGTAGEALRGDPRDPCGLAGQVLSDPVPTGPTVGEPGRRGGPGRDGNPGAPAVDGDDGDGPSPAQVQAAVDAALAADPPADGRTPTTTEVTAAVAEFLAANPPQPGRAPTVQEIGGAVAEFFTANPPPAGRDGRTPSAQEIRDVVRAELADNPPPGGVAGDTGAQGVGVTAVRREQTDTGCALVFTFADPATGESTEQAVPVPDQVCADDAPLDVEPEADQ